MAAAMKKHSTIGCCGIDCGLCPRFHTNGPSACPGCGGAGFKDKHPSCGILTCCVLKKGLEVCSDCPEYPCSRYESEKEGRDSFVTHQKVFENLDAIRDKGMDCFLEQQAKRMEILDNFLAQYDDGRSKNFFCISCALLPLTVLQEARAFMDDLTDTIVVDGKTKLLKDKLYKLAEALEIELKLRK